MGVPGTITYMYTNHHVRTSNIRRQSLTSQVHELYFVGDTLRRKTALCEASYQPDDSGRSQLR